MPLNLLIAVPHVTGPFSSTSPQRGLAEGSPIRPQSQQELQMGWVIAKITAAARVDGPPSCSAQDETRCLQIATGQWCSTKHATWFPFRSTAESYAVDYGYSIGRDVRILRAQKV